MRKKPTFGGDTVSFKSFPWLWHHRTPPLTRTNFFIFFLLQLFADSHCQFIGLPDNIKTKVVGLSATHDFINFRNQQLRAGVPQSIVEEMTEHFPLAHHPVIRTHPETGRKALYLGGKLLKYIVGMNKSESTALLDELYGHCQEDRFIYKHKWRQGDVVFWDNRCTMHHAQPYDDKHFTRHMHRTTVQGDKPA